MATSKVSEASSGDVNAEEELVALVAEGYVRHADISGSAVYWWATESERSLHQLRMYTAQVEELEKEGHESIVKEHIKRLHRYNEAKDAGQLLLGRLAEINGVRTIEMYKEYGLEETD